MLRKIWDQMDGKKLWAAVVGFVTLYGVPYCRARWPWLPWDEILIPLLTGLGVVGLGHKVMKANAVKRAASPGKIDILNTTTKD